MTLLYLDPGTGSLLIQFTIATVTALLLFYKQIKLKLLYLFSRMFGKNQEDEE